MAEVSFRSVSKRYGAVTALADLDLDIAPGEFVSLLGPSGSGKSTTLNLLSGLQDVDGGRIVIGGRDVTHVAPDKRDIALVFQNYALYPHLTIFENIAFPLEARGLGSKADIEKKVNATAATLGIGDLLGRYPKEISGGQQQRVALGRAMVRDPKVFLLDEPLSNLDARLRIRMRRDLKALHAKLGSTIVYVTHDQSEAMTLSDRIAIFNRGRLQQLGTPDEIYNRPVNIFVANFVGDRETNFFDAELVVTSDGQRLLGEGFVIPLDRPAPSSPARNGVKVGIRPECVIITGSGSEGTIPAEVSGTELAGPDLYVFARLPGGEELGCRCEPHVSVRVGELVHLRLDQRRIHLFDPASETCISHGAPISSH
ncbi:MULTISPECIES: ABC transporter ATP-binding protein [unclassified Chelatococcus]|uniref:ABC transporter ATP-binding protein n=1 Tax=unclassified Chelatococcus TaxID=2638111 RepID=UPI001BD13EC2|nr:MULTISPECIES: ABC transporter ATP-binding protein [unclassified Chelatococcus]MBS7700587.1 ABC transporter ATP-binding protein [Chelatococcus sp. YT9]MBX3558702.1 ABC transporter ATP-binding protein [Chelatococcus sp.]